MQKGTRSVIEHAVVTKHKVRKCVSIAAEKMVTPAKDGAMIGNPVRAIFVDVPLYKIELNHPAVRCWTWESELPCRSRLEIATLLAQRTG